MGRKSTIDKLPAEVKDSVQADIAACQPFHGGLPEFPAVSPTAEFGFDDIESDKPEALTISYCRNRGDQLAVQEAGEKSLRIGCKK